MHRPLESINPQPSDFGHSDIGALLTSLLALDGVTVAVASFGRHDVIKKAIGTVLPEELAAQVYFVAAHGLWCTYTDLYHVHTIPPYHVLNTLT